jgi:DNA-binding transcriptional LysR family regulator
MMTLSSAQLDAFERIAQCGSFSKASRDLHLTQPALSRRIQSLEAQLELQLFVRNVGGVELTEAGQKLFKYVQSRRVLEEEFRFELNQQTTGGLGGVIKLAGYSSMVHPVAVPALARLMRKNPEVNAQFVVVESSRLADLLQRAVVDFVITDSFIDRSEIKGQLLGHEVFVAVESTRYRGREGTYLDSSPEDRATEQFFAAQKRNPPHYRRSYMHDEAGIMNGVIRGLGRAIKPRHLLPKKAPIRIIPEFLPVKKPVFLHYRQHAYDTRLQKAVMAELLKYCPRFLRAAMPSEPPDLSNRVVREVRVALP